MPTYVQATRLRKGNLIKLGNELYRLLELHHLTPGNKRAHIQVRMRNIRTQSLMDEKFRAEEDVERASLDEREMQYMYNDTDHFYFMDTTNFEQIQISAEALGDSKDYLIADIEPSFGKATIRPLDVTGIAPRMPLTDRETLDGARLRAQTATRGLTPPFLTIGLEGGLSADPMVTLTSWAAATDGMRWGYGS